MREMMDGTAMLSDHAIAKRCGAGWIVRCTTGENPWIIDGAVARALNGHPTGRKFVETKAEARKAMAECETPI